jgi:thiamine pyrophosphokinase
MTRPLLRSSEPLLLVGGGAIAADMIAEAHAHARRTVAADGAADALADLGLVPEAIIGDLDSLGDPGHWRRRGVAVHHLAEQDTTDFEKCLYATEAPFYLAAGFTGRRLDHTLAVFHALLRYPEKRVVLLGEEDAVAVLPAGRTVTLDLEVDARVSLFPLATVAAEASAGLVWPLEGLTLAPGRAIGTSNRALARRVSVRMGGPGTLVIVDRRFLGAMVAAVAAEPGLAGS